MSEVRCQKLDVGSKKHGQLKEDGGSAATLVSRQVFDRERIGREGLIFAVNPGRVMALTGRKGIARGEAKDEG
jgi:hypothetical protein